MSKRIHLSHALVLFAHGAISLSLSNSFLCAQQSVRFAVIGDYGKASQPELDVSNLVKSWNLDFIITTGDNNYEYGEASTIDPNVGQYYHEFISPYIGSYGSGDTVNRFFPSLGNHDWIQTGATPYFSYFALPGNERYYDFVRGPVHLFCIDSDPHEPDGNTSTSTQALWLRDQLSISTARWNVVYFHHPPYSSGSRHGSALGMRWSFRQWGATAILSGHEHQYERLIEDSLVYFVIGNSGKDLYAFGTPIAGSQVRFNANFGAQLVTANDDSITFRFFTRTDSLVDTYTILAPPPPPALDTPSDGSIDQPATLTLTWSPVATASSYHLQVSTSPIFTSTVVDDSFQTATHKLVGSLLGGITYYWRVRARNSGGVSEFSSTWHFTTLNDVRPAYDVTVKKGWNLLSVPVAAFDARTHSIYPDAKSNAFRYDSTGYYRIDTLPSMMGFWLKFRNGGAIAIEGDTLFTDTVDVAEGWNLIGTISFPCTMSDIVQQPESIISSDFYRYDLRYAVTDTLVPGQGYWIKAKQPGKLIFQSPTK